MRSRVTTCISALIILGALFTFGSSSSFADVPDSIHYQGILKTPGGSPVADAVYGVTFNIYDVASGPDPALWTETKSVSTVDGLFTTFLGSVTALPHMVFSGPNRFLGITVGADPEMTPRTTLVAVPYAYRIATVDGATGGSISGNINLDPSTATAGNIIKGGVPFLHNYGSENTFVGLEAGNLTMTGSFNTASGSEALLNNTTGYYNTALGYSANVSDSDLVNATAIGANAVVDASNKIRLGDSAVTVIEGQVAYTFTSDKHQKENFRAVDGDEVLRKIRGLNLSSWNYIGHDPEQLRHYGPVAQEFFAAFGHDGVGTSGSPTTINSGDEVGILMIAVQALGRDNEQQKSENQYLREQIAELRELIRAQATQPK